jgi:2-oxo-3-hexenedioate decarboxylase
MTTDLKHEGIAAEVLDALEAVRQIGPFSERMPDFAMADAYGVTAVLRQRRMARGERSVGRKIGFTNNAIWNEYGVHAPIWGDMYDTTVRDIGAAAFDLSPLLEPKIEPEIVFGLAAAPTPGMDEAAMLDCIGWVAHGFEMVQSVYPGWRFTAPDAVAGFGMHGGLLVGPRREIADAPAEGWMAALSSFTITLTRNGETVDAGGGANVLGSPLTALRHLVMLLSGDNHNPPLAAGEIVTTGTLTRAFDVAPGETWATKIEGLPVEGLEVRFS